MHSIHRCLTFLTSFHVLTIIFSHFRVIFNGMCIHTYGRYICNVFPRQQVILAVLACMGRLCLGHPWVGESESERIRHFMQDCWSTLHIFALVVHGVCGGSDTPGPTLQCNRGWRCFTLMAPAFCCTESSLRLHCTTMSPPFLTAELPKDEERQKLALRWRTNERARH